MPNSSAAPRVCAGGHIVTDANIIGMTTPSEGKVELYCVDHPDLFDSRLTDIGSVPLQM